MTALDVRPNDTASRPDFLSLGAALCLATIPWSLRINTLVIIGFGVSVIAFILFKKKSFKINVKPFLITAAIFVVALFWMLNTEDYKLGLKYLERSLSALIFPLLFSLLIHHYTLNRGLIFRVFLLSCALRYFVFLFEILEFELIFIIDYWKEILIQFNQLCKVHGMHPSYFSIYLGFCSLICYDQFSQSNRRVVKFGWLLGVAAFLVLNLSLAAKMPFIATCISIFLAIVYFSIRNSTKKRRRKIVFSLTVVSLLLLLFLLKVPNPISQDISNYYKVLNNKEVTDIYDYNQYGAKSSLETWEKTNRIHIWKSGIQVVKENFLLGVGTGDITAELNQKFNLDGQEYLSIKNTNSHNQILDYLIKYGVFGLVIILFVLAKYFGLSWKNDDQLYFMFLVLVSLCMLTENILNRQYGIVFFFYLNTLFYFYAPNSPKGKTNENVLV